MMTEIIERKEDMIVAEFAVPVCRHRHSVLRSGLSPHRR